MTSNQRPLTREEIVRLDKAHVWHPYTPMDAYIDEVDPIVVRRAEGAWLEDVDGTRYLDGNSSWYVAGLGHGHPRLLRILSEQAATLAHCSLAGTTHEPAARLASELCAIAPPGLTRVFYTDNGSSSIELAVKMSVQMWRQRGGASGAGAKKTRFVALDGAFHGDTIGATSLGGVEVFRRPFADLVFDCVRVPSPADGGHARAFEAMRRALREGKDTIAAVVVEPIVQAAAGMHIYDAAFLRELRDECTANDVLLVVDEVFTGYGRTGPMWATSHAGIAPDIMCLGKAFAALLPMGAVLTTDVVFDAFRGGKENALFYGHTFCGNPLGAALAREVLAIHRDERVLDRVTASAPRIAAAFARVAELRGVERVRSIGMLGAADLRDATAGAGARAGVRAGVRKGYLSNIGWRVYDEARRRGAYLRPLGDTVYVCPPLTIEPADLESLLGILEESVRAVVAGESSAPARTRVEAAASSHSSVDAGAPLLTIVAIGGSRRPDAQPGVDVLAVDTLASVAPTGVRGEIVACTGGDQDVSIDGLLRLAAALKAAPTFQAARGGYVHVDWSDAATFCPAPSNEDLLLELLLGSPFPAPLSSFVFTRDAWLRMQSEGARSDADFSWASRESLAAFAMTGSRCLSLDVLAARVGAAMPVARADHAREGQKTFARLQARASSARISELHRRFLAQDWSLWRLAPTTVVAGERTRSTGAAGTIVGHALAGIRDADTIEGLCNRVRMRAPRLELTPIRVRDAVEGLAEDGLIVREPREP